MPSVRKVTEQHPRARYRGLFNTRFARIASLGFGELRKPYRDLHSHLHKTSNTGGQASKATPIGAIAKFAAAGKRVRKKDLGMIATTYGYVYVAQIAMGADQAQTLKAIREAEAYPGPSLIIAYAPCINHGLKAGMGKSQAEEAKAVECGYWHLWRYNPQLEAEGKNPFALDSKEPQWDKFADYLKGEVRFASVMKQFPAEAADLFKAAEDNAKWRYRSYQRMLSTDWSKPEGE